jgi:hypothetical protein
MSAHQIWPQISAGFPAQVDPGDAGTFICDRYHNYLPLVSGSGAETRTIQTPDLACELDIDFVTDGGGTVTIGFEAAFDSSSNVTAAFADAGDCLHMRALPNRRGWRLISNDGTTLA